MRQQIREMLATHAPYTQVKPLWTRLRTEMEEDLKAWQYKLDTDNVKINADPRKKEGRLESL
jgi:hypothetical protein